MIVFIVISVIIIIFFPCILLYYRRLTIEKAANLAVSLGILGTFLGITFGLLAFDVSNIISSVPQLLEGLRFSFVTSITGLMVSIALKIISQNQFFSRLLDSEEKKDNENIEKLNLALSKIQKSVAPNEFTTVISVLDSFEITIADQLKELILVLGRFEITTANQLKELRLEVSKLNQSFESFAEKVVENSTNSIVKALERIVNNFNESISEQFGENFAQFNDALGRMLDWQKENSRQMLFINSQFEKTLGAIEKSEQTLNDLTEKAGIYQEVSVELKSQLENIENGFTSMKNIADSATKSFEGVGKQAAMFSEIMSQNMSKIAEYTENLQVHNEKIASSISSLTQSVEIFLEEQEANIKKVNKEIEKMMKENAKLIKEQISNLNKGLEIALTNSLSSLGSQLVSLSRKFVNDYTPLTERLREVVELAENLKLPNDQKNENKYEPLD